MLHSYSREKQLGNASDEKSICTKSALPKEVYHDNICDGMISLIGHRMKMLSPRLDGVGDSQAVFFARLSVESCVWRE